LFEGISNPIICDIDQKSAIEELKKASIIFYLDFNSLERVDKMSESLNFSTAYKIMIDHHIDPEPIADIIISDTSASSTSELIYLFIKELSGKDYVLPAIGEALFTGIITDTGSFKYNTRPLTYEIAAKLKQCGVDDYAIQNLIFNSLDAKYLKLLGHCLANRMVILEEHRAAYIYLTKEDYATYSIGRGDTEGIVNYMLMMKNIDIAAFIMEQPSIIKISLRSKNDVNVQQMATAYFNGGGHRNAAGGSAYAKLDDIIAKFIKVVPQYKK
jgi:phosphoesterase RecJ-like protein